MRPPLAVFAFALVALAAFAGAAAAQEAAMEVVLVPPTEPIHPRLGGLDVDGVVRVPCALAMQDMLSSANPRQHGNVTLEAWGESWFRELRPDPPYLFVSAFGCRPDGYVESSFRLLGWLHAGAPAFETGTASVAATFAGARAEAEVAFEPAYYADLAVTRRGGSAGGLEPGTAEEVELRVGALTNAPTRVRIDVEHTPRGWTVAAPAEVLLHPASLGPPDARTVTTGSLTLLAPARCADAAEHDYVGLRAAARHADRPELEEGVAQAAFAVNVRCDHFVDRALKSPLVPLTAAAGLLGAVGLVAGRSRKG